MLLNLLLLWRKVVIKECDSGGRTISYHLLAESEKIPDLWAQIIIHSSGLQVQSVPRQLQKYLTMLNLRHSYFWQSDTCLRWASDNRWASRLWSSINTAQAQHLYTSTRFTHSKPATNPEKNEYREHKRPLISLNFTTNLHIKILSKSFTFQSRQESQLTYNWMVKNIRQSYNSIMRSSWKESRTKEAKHTNMKWISVITSPYITNS